MSLTFVMDVIRTFLSLIDKMVYWFMELLINLFDKLATIQIFSTHTVELLADRLFILISIIMVFKVSFSIIQYIINPDSFSNSEKGMGKVVQSVLLVLVALVAVKHVFNIAYDLQKKVIDEEIIPKIVLGISNVSTTSQEESKKDLPYHILSAFYKRVDGDPAEPINAKYKLANKNKDYIALLDLVNVKKASNPDEYIFDYKFIVSTIAGAFVVIIYLNFCIDLAIRSAKFGFLQLIAPIPIISMVDPKSSKSGMMSKYVKQCMNTYLGLFLRIAAVNFVIFIMDIIMSADFANNLNTQADLNIFIELIIIFGALMFAKDLPKLISDLTGVDFKGDFKLNPFKRVTENPITGKVTAGALGLAGGVAANTVASLSNLRNMQWKGQNASGILRNIRDIGGMPFSWAAGGISSGARGLVSKEKDGLAGARAGIRGSVAARNLRDERQANGDGGIHGALRRTGVNIQNWSGVDAAATKFDHQIEEYSKVEQDADAILKRAADEMIKYDDIKWGTKFDANGDVLESCTMAQLKADKERLNVYRSSGMDENGQKVSAEVISALQTKIAKNEKMAAQAYVNYAIDRTDGIVNDNRIRSMVEGLNNAIATSSDSAVKSHSAATGSDIKALKDAMGDAKARVQNSTEYKQAQINKRNDAKK